MIKSTTYAHLVSLAYNWIPPQGYEILCELPDKFGWVLKDKEEEAVLIIVRGTMDNLDILADMDFKLVETPYGKVHGGFWDDTQKLLVSIYTALSTLSIDTPIILAGHSLGASIVTLIATALASHSKDLKLKVYTFASPKVGDESFVKHYQSLNIDTLRYVNKLDVVPMAPEGFGYNHVCGEVEFNDCIFGNIFYNHSLDTYMRNVGMLGFD